MWRVKILKNFHHFPSSFPVAVQATKSSAGRRGHDESFSRWVLARVRDDICSGRYLCFELMLIEISQ